ncbi:polycystic kidney disease protein 1-like 3 [Teratosphaeria destructans]|uniref:Polycystic kidney disease protein 1-like 3 n=1 Tax=Teratosphaeria destructans TaxID=418781 RepID=A0A9W7SQU8_9PEZI|nr:polycystic kidney disease protein 1-like 3 [Teratosphaeria destructans]
MPPGRIDVGQVHETVDSRFFHASDAPKQLSASNRLEAKRPAFFYADGKEEEHSPLSLDARSPVLSASDDRQPGLRTQQNFANAAHTSKSPPMLSPALSGISTLSNASPYFAAAIGQQLPRSASPSKENLHLSYRKGASQIFGARPTPRSSVEMLWEERNSKAETPAAHQAYGKSPSLSSIDSGSTPESKRQSITIDHTPSPLSNEMKSATMPSLTKPPNGMPIIDTSLEPPSPDVRFGLDTVLLSPTRSVSELAADARRERKVLDLEISNSSLLAINTSLERELRKQKAELKRFRRLSRAGRLSYASTDPGTRFPDGLSGIGKDDDEGSEHDFRLPYDFDDLSEDDETESLLSGGDSLSPGSQGLEQDRLAKDEKRLRVDLEKHKELLIQSQVMNQSLKRCMFATESMIQDGRKALDYQVRVSDVKIGGRVLSGHEDEDEDERREEIEVDDETLHGDVAAENFLNVWQGVGRPYPESSEGGDRDSGIEADRPPPRVETQNPDSGRPPETG